MVSAALKTSPASRRDATNVAIAPVNPARGHEEEIGQAVDIAQRDRGDVFPRQSVESHHGALGAAGDGAREV